MLGFTPFKKHANKFHYVPRYYDPEKEARELRRAELRGERAEDAEREYRPGQYIRTQRDARAARRERDEGRGRMRVWKMLAAAAVAMAAEVPHTDMSAEMTMFRVREGILSTFWPKM